MGRKAKLKKQKKLSFESANSDQFIQHIERQGYGFKKPKKAPNIPEKRIDPQI